MSHNSLLLPHRTCKNRIKKQLLGKWNCMFYINPSAREANEDVSFFEMKIIMKTDVEEFIKLMKVFGNHSWNHSTQKKSKMTRGLERNLPSSRKWQLTGTKWLSFLSPFLWLKPFFNMRRGESFVTSFVWIIAKSCDFKTVCDALHHNLRLQ